MTPIPQIWAGHAVVVQVLLKISGAKLEPCETSGGWTPYDL